MHQQTDPGDALTLAELRRALEAGGYTEAGLGAVLGTDGAPGSVRESDASFYRLRLSGGEPLAALIRLFLLGDPLGAAEAAAALAPAALERLEAAGILEREGAAVRSPLRLAPHDGLVCAHDPEDPATLAADHVAGIGPASKTLARLTVRLPVASALDLGAGCGVQALLAARHAERAVAVDINPRALRYTALNARLNGLANVECLEGSLLEPVGRASFDLVVANPPFVISPDSDYVFRDSDLPADEISRAVVSQIPAHLNEGGFASVLCNWVTRPGEGASAPLRAWVEGSGCDALLLHYGTEDPLSYAAKWNEPLRLSDPPAYAGALDRWSGYYRSQGIEAIASGAVVLRRRAAGPSWVREVEMPYGPAGACGAHILRIFAARDRLEALGDPRALLGEVLLPVEGSRLDQALERRDGEWGVRGVLLSLEEGLGIPGPVEPQEVAHVLLRLDGEQPLGDAVAGAAAEHGLNPDALAADALAAVRELLGLGFLAWRERPSPPAPPGPGTPAWPAGQAAPPNPGPAAKDPASPPDPQ